MFKCYFETCCLDFLRFIIIQFHNHASNLKQLLFAIYGLMVEVFVYQFQCNQQYRQEVIFKKKTIMSKRTNRQILKILSFDQILRGCIAERLDLSTYYTLNITV